MESVADKAGSMWRWFRWLLPAALILLVTSCLAIEPMRWSLPFRYMFEPLDIYRLGGFDYIMCMRVALSPEEARAFITDKFEPEEWVVQPVPMEQAICPAPFWPVTFTAPTIGYAVVYWPNGMVEGSTGAVYENGYLYYWSNMQ